MLTVVTWHWGTLFAPMYVNRLHSMLLRNLRLPFELVCVTNDPHGISPDVRIVAPPPPLPGAIRCRRRMWQFASERVADFGDRMLCIDLDVVITDNITPLVDRPEPLVCWRVGYANVYSGSFLLLDTGALGGMWRTYESAPIEFPRRTGERNASDQAMLNYWLRGKRVAEWTESDGLVTWFGAGYEARERFGMGPTRNTLPPGTRVVVLGSADKHVMDDGQFDFVRTHWR